MLSKEEEFCYQIFKSKKKFLLEMDLNADYEIFYLRELQSNKLGNNLYNKIILFNHTEAVYRLGFIINSMKKFNHEKVEYVIQEAKKTISYQCNINQSDINLKLDFFITCKRIKENYKLLNVEQGDIAFFDASYYVTVYEVK
jgi:hypothetical protein